MEIDTCQKYVLAELEDLKKDNEYCQKYVLAELEDLKKDNEYWIGYAGKLRDERDALARKVSELTEQLSRATEQASAAILRANELQRMASTSTVQDFEPVREVRDGDAV